MRALVSLVAVLLVGCDPGFRPETLVEDLRLLSVSASPASVRPGETARISALVLDPSRSQPSSVLWLGCAPDPYNQNRSVCANPEVLNDPTALSTGGTLPEGVEVIGFNETAMYRVQPTLFDVLPSDDPRRLTGTVGIVIAIAVAETVSPAATPAQLEALFERVRSKEVKSIVAIFRLAVSEQPTVNQNPVADALVVGNERWPRGAQALMRPREPVTLDVAAPQSTFERFERITPSGAEQVTERVLAAWYSTAGRFTETNTALTESVRTIFRAPGTETDPIPPSRRGTLYTVLRDTRGGQGWSSYGFVVCDDDAPDPVIRSVSWPGTTQGRVVLEGEALQSVVDLVVDDVALEDGAFDPATQQWSGFLPSDVAVGSARGTLHTARCQRRPLAP